MPLGSRAEKWIGIGTIWITILPFLIINGWLFFGINMFLMPATSGQNGLVLTVVSGIPFVVLTLLQCPTIPLQFLLMIVYFKHIIENPELSEGVQIGLCFATFVLGFIVMPIYYLRYMRNAPLNNNQLGTGKKQTSTPASSKRRVLLLGVGIPLALCLLPLVFFAGQIIYALIKPPSASTPISDTMKAAQNQSGQFAIAYPDNWYYTEATFDEHADFSPIAYIDYLHFTGMGVFGTILRSNISFNALSEVVKRDEELENLEQTRYPNAVPPTAASINRTLSLEEHNIKDEQTLLREYTYAEYGPLGMSTIVIHCLSNYRIHNQRGYIIRFCANDNEYSLDAPTFLRMIESFSYLD